MSQSSSVAPLSSRRLKRLPLALLLAGSAHWLPAQAADAEAAQSAPAAKSDSQLKTVTVTARRREESAQDVPTPMSVLDGQALESQRIYRIQDLQQLVPSVNVAYMHARQSSV